MVLNIVFILFFFIGFLVSLYKLIIEKDLEVFSKMSSSVFDMSKTAFHIALYLTGGMCFWLGIMRIGEKGGAIHILSKIIQPFFRRIFPDISKDHPAFSAMLMNFSANMLGLDNAATPLGLKAMKELENINPKKGTASNSQIMFLVLNTSGLTIIPVSIMILRSEHGAVNPTDVFLPILMATFCSSMAGLILVSIIQKINLLDPVIISWLLGITLFIGSSFYLFQKLDQTQLKHISGTISGIIIFSIICIFIILAIVKKVNVYDQFIIGAKEGFNVAVMVIPYLVAILTAIAIFRASGAMEMLMDGIKKLFSIFSMDTRFVDGLPTAFMKPFSGSGARGLMVDAMQKHGVDSFVGRLTSCFQGSTETTFYTLAVYFGAVGVHRTRYTAAAGLFADVVGMISAIIIAYIFFG